MKDCNRVNINVPMTIRKFYLCSWTCEMCNLMMLLSILMKKDFLGGFFVCYCGFQFLIEQFWYLIFISCTRKCIRQHVTFCAFENFPFFYSSELGMFLSISRVLEYVKWSSINAFLIHYYIWQNLETFTYHNRKFTSFVII